MSFTLLVDSCVLHGDTIFPKCGATQVECCDSNEMRRRLTSGAFDGVVVRSTTRLDRELLEGCDVRFAATATVGVDHVDEAYLASRGISFAHAAGSSARTVAEFTLCLAIAALARLGRDPLEGLTLAVIGHGAIGSKVAAGARALGWKTLAVDPPLQRRGQDHMVPLADALAEADLISLHVPLTLSGDDATLDMVNAGFLAAIKRGAVLINTARGAVVDEDSLKGALDSGRLGGAVLDVFRNEPTPSTALMDAATIVTPHVAGRTVDGMGANTVAIGEQLAVFLGSPATADLSLPDTQPLVARIGDGSMAEIVGKTWDLPLIEATLQAAEGGFREARTLAERRRDISMHRLPQSATSQQRRLHEILDSL